MNFKGRGFKVPVIAHTVTDREIVVRVDCDLNPEAWGELRLSRADLVAALAEIDAAGAVAETVTGGGAD